MNALISICIPTYHRPDLLHQAIDSCLKQSYTEIEIIVCDDSKDDASEQVVKELAKPELIRYYRNRPSLGQANNVNRLFDLARGDRLVLLHDDDLLLPNAIQMLTECWNLDSDIIACFGKQSIIETNGTLLEEDTQKLNQDYYRTADYIGCQTSALWSAIVAQFPNDGYMVKTSVAQRVKYRNDASVGDACDLDFGIRLAAQPGKFYFLNQYTAQYRFTETSISTTQNYTHLTYSLLASLDLPEKLEPARTNRLSQYAEKAINAWLSFGDKSSAYQIYASQYYSWTKRLSVKGLMQLLLMLFPGFFSSRLIQTFKTYKLRRRFS